MKESIPEIKPVQNVLKKFGMWLRLISGLINAGNAEVVG
jgi:hypothetical protein